LNTAAQKPISDWKTRRVLVTGADGFVGRWLVNALAERKARVWALVWSSVKQGKNAAFLKVPPGLETIRGDITDLGQMSRLIAESAIDTVYHLAASNINTGSKVSPYNVFETNVRGVYTVLEACRLAPQAVSAIVSSSKEVEDCFNPTARRKHHPYMTSKAAAELLSRAYTDTFDVPVALIRSDNLYGGGDFNWARLVPGTMRSVFRGEVPIIRSNGLFQRDYVYIEDAIAAYLAVGERLEDPAVKGQLFRIATGVGTSVLEIVQHIVRAAGLSQMEPRILNEKSEERVDSFYSPVIERKVLGWSAQSTLEEGLRRTCDWYRNFFKSEPGLNNAPSVN
jgi:CDP-glucose 4,6-dehydratase